MQDVCAQLASVGLIVDGYPEIGKLKRCKAEGDRGGKNSGWYSLHDFPLRDGSSVVTGSFGNWRLYGNQVFKIEFELPTLSDEERAEFAKRQIEQREQAEQEKNQREADAAKRAARIFSKLPDTGISDYLKRKKVRAFGLRFSRGSIVVPVQSIGGGLVGLQFIAADGSKKFLTGTAKRGAFHLIGEIDPAQPLAVAEGYATAASIHMATGWPVAVAFDAGNLVPVTQALRAQWPDQSMVLCADDDSQTDGNPGVTKATEAARLVGAALCVPNFSAVQARAA